MPDPLPLRDLVALTAPLRAPAVQVLVSDAPSRSHFGGDPGLPPALSWPEKGGKKLGFLARLSLGEIHDAHNIPWLPTSGALLFFYDREEQPWGFDPKHRDSFVVLHVPDLPGQIAQPAQSSELDGAISHRNASFRRIDVLPSGEHDEYTALQLNDRESDEYGNLQDASYNGKPRHQLSGFPSTIQGDQMALESQLVSNGIYCGDARGYKDRRATALKAGQANWRLLLQMDSDDELRIMWGDLGRLYFWVEEQKAVAGDFSNAWLILQCY